MVAVASVVWTSAAALRPVKVLLAMVMFFRVLPSSKLFLLLS